MNYQKEDVEGREDYSLLISGKIEPVTLLEHIFKKVLGCSYKTYTYEGDNIISYNGISDHLMFNVGIPEYKDDTTLIKKYYLGKFLKGVSTYRKLKFNQTQLGFVLGYVNIFLQDFSEDFVLIDDSMNPYVIRHNGKVFVIEPVMHTWLQKYVDKPFEVRNISDFEIP